MDLKDIDLISFQNLKYLEKYNITTQENTRKRKKKREK